MKPKLLPLFTLIILNSLVLLHSCAPTEDDPVTCENSPPSYYSLTADQKAITPYKGFDTIRMVSNTGDTIHCIGKGKQFLNTRVFEQHPHPTCAGYGKEKFYEAYKITFVDSVKGKTIELMHYDYYPEPPYSTFSVVSVDFLGGRGLTVDYRISNSNAYNFIGNIQLRGREYYSVTKAESEPVNQNEFVLINRANGIIKIQLNATESWELIDH